MSLKPASKEAFDLLLKGAESMARIEQAGIKIDVPYLEFAISQVSNRIAEMDAAISSSEEYQLWGRIYGNSMKPGSRQQLGDIIFNHMGHKRNPFMGASNDVAAFEHLKLPFVRAWQDVERLKKALSTNLKGILKETVNGFLHPFFDLHTAESYRSSSSKPNFQNQPIRNKDISKIVRSCMIPREGHIFLEPDLETHEVRISYCYNKDPNLRHDILTGDMHKDRSMELFMLTEEELGPIDDSKLPGKMTRYCAKNMFVFLEFYGGYYKGSAPSIWDAIAILDLKRSDGVSMYEHLASKGIRRLGSCKDGEEPKKGTFEYHVKEVERRMWEERYPVYKTWKENWWNLYQAQGGVNTKTGFKQEGVFRRNQILCDPIQGSAFHCLLWTIIETLQEFRKRKMRSKIVVQVHDSMLIDTHLSEVEDVVKIVSDIILRRLPDAWKWITIPLGMGWDKCEKNWFDKTSMAL